MDERVDTPSADGEVAVEKPARRRRRFPVKTVVAVAIIVILGLPVFSTLQPRYYERYPDLAPRMENWRNSTHARIACSGCHVEPGVIGTLGFAAKSIPAFYSQLVMGPHPDNLLGVPSVEACQKCHTSYRQVSSNGDLLIPHRAHVEVLEIDCAQCHKDLVHTENTQGYNGPKMAGCLECHDGDAASDACTDCHTRKHVPDDHRRPDWLEVHSQMVDVVDCGECHAWSPDYCAECHAKKPASHAGNWKKGHAPVALERGPAGCMTCHDDAFCKDCHD